MPNKQPSWPPVAGDTVTVRDDLVVGQMYGYILITSSTDLIGKESAITSFDMAGHFYLKGSFQRFSLEMLVKPEAATEPFKWRNLSHAESKHLHESETRLNGDVQFRFNDAECNRWFTLNAAITSDYKRHTYRTKKPAGHYLPSEHTEAATEPFKCTEAQRREQLSPLFSNGVVMLDDIIAIDKKMGMIQEGGE